MRKGTTTPKQVNDFAKKAVAFAKEYEQMYLELSQLKAAYEIVKKELDELKLNNIKDANFKII